VITLNNTFAIPICLLAVDQVSDARRAVNVVPIFAHNMIANPASKVIIPLLNAASVITPTAPLDCTSAVMIIPMIPNIQRFISLYCSKLNTCDITSTFSLRKSIPKKNNPNHTRSFARYDRYLLPDTIMIAHQIAMRGNANADILNSQNHKYHTISPVAVDQIFAHTNTHTALTNFIIPALTNPRVRSEIRVLLLSIPVMIVPTNVAFHHLSVYFWSIILSFGHQSFLSASSNISIPKRIIHNHAHNIHQFIQEVISYKC